MKKLIILLLCIMASTGSYAQKYNFVSDYTYKPYSFEEMILPFMLYAQNSERMRQIQEQREKEAEQRFDEYTAKAYECFNAKDYQGFIYYSSIALDTGWYRTEMYYHRGIAFEELHDYKQAKKQYKIALSYGYLPAKSALEFVKEHKKEWKRSQK